MSYVQSGVAAAATVLGLCLLWLFLHQQSKLVGHGAGSSVAWLQPAGRSEILVPLRRLASLQQAGAAPVRTPGRLSALRLRPSAAASRARPGTAALLARPGAAPLQGPPGMAAPEGQPSPAAPRVARRAAAADVGVEEFLAACGFSAADLPGQHMGWHTASSACAVLGRLERLVLVGDSVTRQAQAAQLFEALVQLLRGDLRRGALRADAPADVAARCACREQAEPGCHIYTEAWPASPAWLDGAPLASAELTPCPAAPHFRMQFFHTYHDWTHEASTRDTMALVRSAVCQRPGSLVVVAGAPAHEHREREGFPWARLDARFSVRHLIAPMRSLAQQCAVPPENLVWAPMHWVDTGKVPEQWRAGLHPKDVLRYNRLTSAAARAANLTVLDTYNMTRGGATLDGVYVPAPVSLAKLQLLLSMVEARLAAPAAAMSAAL